MLIITKISHLFDIIATNPTNISVFNFTPQNPMNYMANIPIGNEFNKNSNVKLEDNNAFMDPKQNKTAQNIKKFNIPNPPMQNCMKILKYL